MKRKRVRSGVLGRSLKGMVSSLFTSGKTGLPHLALALRFSISIIVLDFSGIQQVYTLQDSPCENWYNVYDPFP